MTTRTLFVGAPGQKPPDNTPISDKDCAIAIRKNLWECVDESLDNVEHVVQQILIISQCQGWKYIKDGKGGFFKTFADFCEGRRPHGLGCPFDRLRPFWEQAIARQGQSPDKVIGLTLVPDAKASVAGPGRGHVKPSAESADGFSERQNNRHDQRIRAVSRAPEAARDLYRADLLPQDLAAKLGPKAPTPEQAAQVTAIAQAAAQVVKDAPKPKDEKEKRALRAKVVEVVKAALEPDAPSLYERKGDALVKQVAQLEPLVRSDVVARAALALPAIERAALIKQLQQSLEASR